MTAYTEWAIYALVVGLTLATCVAVARHMWVSMLVGVGFTSLAAGVGLQWAAMQDYFEQDIATSVYIGVLDQGQVLEPRYSYFSLPATIFDTMMYVAIVAFALAALAVVARGVALLVRTKSLFGRRAPKSTATSLERDQQYVAVRQQFTPSQTYAPVGD